MPFHSVAMTENNPQYSLALQREQALPERYQDTRSPFYRDYTRILHSRAYRRLKHKTQAFYATGNDHICTRIEHVQHVASISYALALALGLNTELVQAIALGHDLGHAPFGHHGEIILRKLVQKHIEPGRPYWHERNSLYFVDSIETLPDSQGIEQNLNLTYAVRDGIICHCGEVKTKALRPRILRMDLHSISAPAEVEAWTWEGCVMKIADKISYLGRDIEDALTLRILEDSENQELMELMLVGLGDSVQEMQQELSTNERLVRITNTLLINTFISDLIAHSSIDAGLSFSPSGFALMNALMDFSNQHIYRHRRLQAFAKYAELMLTQLFEHLAAYCSEDGQSETIVKHLEQDQTTYPELCGNFRAYLRKYAFPVQGEPRSALHGNRPIYQIETKEGYYQAIIDFLSGMTDHYAMKTFQELIQL